MPIENTVAGALIAFVTRHLSCAHCAQAYTADDIAVIRHDGARWSLRAVCSTCQDIRLVTAYDGPPYCFRWPGILNPPRITTEDVRDWRAFLATFDGDLLALLHNGDPPAPGQPDEG
jgi:hypothetical protein